MSDPIQRIGSYLGHLLKARTRHGVHSPFVYQLTSEVLLPKSTPSECLPIEELRRELLRSGRTIRVTDLGAGSKVLDGHVRRVSDIAQSALKSPRQAALLYRLARFLRPAEVLELGTSFGITTLYLAAGAEEGRVTTIEGCPQTHSIAQQHFKWMERSNIQAMLGNFQTRLPEALRMIKRLDLAFLDGHHAKKPTLRYFELCLEHAHNDTVFVFDDIHWSRDMEEAWEAVKAHPRVTVTIDLFDLGLVLLRKEQAPQHFVLRY